MVTADRPRMRSLIKKVINFAKQHISDEVQLKLFSRFIRLFYMHASVSDLKHRSVTELYGMVQSHWELVCRQQKPGRRHIRVFNPDIERDGWCSTHTIIELITRDMPFVVDSMRMALNRLGLTIHQMIYMGGMKVCRDKRGFVTDVAAYHANDKEICSTIESPVYMEIDRQTDPKMIERIDANLEHVLDDVQLTVDDWQLMQDRVKESIEAISQEHLTQSKGEVSESIAFLKWLLEGQFTFLGVRDYEVVGEGESMALRLIKGSGLGVLRNEANCKMLRQFSDMPEHARELFLSRKQILTISKTNTISTVHREAYTDYIGIKRFNKKGELAGERRIIGLYTSAAYSSHPKDIPFLRRKVVSILKKSGFPPKSHAGKDLMHILETFPRDDLFQGTTKELLEIALGVLNLQERKKVSVFVREDAYSRYISCLVYVPRDNFSSQLIHRVKDLLMKTFQGVEASYTTYFYTPVLTRIHYIIRIQSDRKLKYNLADLEKRLIEVGKSWQDGFKESAIKVFGEEHGNQIVEHYVDAFPAGYREAFQPASAVADVKHIEQLSFDDSLGMSLYRESAAPNHEIKFKLYRNEYTVPLSDALPILENMGLRVIGEQPYQLTFKNGHQLWINDFSMVYNQDVDLDVDKVRAIFQEAFYKIWLCEAENDLFNSLVLEAELGWREIAILRAYTKYLRQTGFTYSLEYVAETLINYPEIAILLIRLFQARFDPDLPVSVAEKDSSKIEAEIIPKIDDVLLLDEDRIFSRFLAVMKATLRTNFYQRNELGEFKRHISFKLSPKKIPELPLPLPKYELFVYSPFFEGVHLRAAKVARGGIRWSDRREDFRTEVLSLMKAQQVKNAVIVPAGAKGGFVPKNLPIDGSREEILQEATRCYSGFIKGLLDLTDNMEGCDIISPEDTRCYDDDDAYLVVAADKGTATFSDIANQISLDRGYWLGDAFASGGSTGYDHKKMGITARGAWVSAERHFQGLGVNVDNTEVTVVGIGDMSGDVFGNGLLLSPYLKLVCAFNHLHIFIDPDPDPKISFQERKRLFALHRSNWSDYNTRLISAGGGIFSRTAKRIPISVQMKKLFNIEEDTLIPTDLIRAVLKSSVDMIWNGGIGTFVKASTETNEVVSDRANDILRVNGNELKARVIVEGGNLGLTQLGRIEYALNGGLINTDFIDNSAGVDCSDHEVNIKILLNSLVKAGELTEKQRNKLLASMTDEVSCLVLQSNYHQNQAVSFLTLLSPAHINLYMRYMEALEESGKLNRCLEYLPDNKELLDRRANDLGLTSPEIAVLLSYSKIVLEEKIRHSELVDDPYLVSYLKNAFPTQLRKKYIDYILTHRLRNEILSTQLSNHLVSQMGITFVYQMFDETGASVSAIVSAFIAAHKIFQVAEITADIEALDFKVDMSLQSEITHEIVSLVRRATRWLLRNWREQIDISKTIEHFEAPLKGLYKRLPRLLLGCDKVRLENHCNELMAENMPEDLAMRVASARPMYHALNIVLAATSQDEDIYRVAKIYFTLVERLDLHGFRDKINAYPVTHRWSVLAKSAFKSDLDWIQRELTAGVLGLKTTAKTTATRVAAWIARYHDLIARWQLILADLRNEEIADFSIISVAIRELFDLAQTCQQEEKSQNT